MNEVAEETRVSVPANAWIITAWLHLGSFVEERESRIEAGETDSQHRIPTKTLAKRFWRGSSNTSAVDSIYAVSNPDLLLFFFLLGDEQVARAGANSAHR